MLEIVDQFLWTKENKVITRDKHNVPGLANFSHWNFRSATNPAAMHYHTNIFEFHCMLHGRRIFQVMDGSSLRTYIVTGNQAAVTYPGELHGYRDSFVEPYEFYSLQIDVTDPEHLLGLDREYSLQLYATLCEIQKKLSALGEHRLQLGSTHIQLLRTAFNFFSSFDEESIRIGVQFLCCFCFSLKLMSPVTDQPPVDEHIAVSIQYMRDHFTEKPSLQSLARVAGYSLSYFKSKFREETGLTPAAYLSLLRLELAKDRLANTNCSVTQISEDLCFSSTSYFTAAFKKMTSFTPKEYREKYGTAQITSSRKDHPNQE